jgi:GT2 family glycosyltransferase
MIHFIIPIHNRLAHSIKCLESIHNCVSNSYSITVIDDGSSDGSSDYIFENYPSINLIKGDGSLYWTGAIKLGVESVLKYAKKNDYLMSLNNDVVLSSTTILELLKEGKNNRKCLYNALSISLADKDKTITSGTIIKSWLLNTTYHIFNGVSYSKLSNFNPVEVDLLTGRSVLYPVELFQSIGNFDSKFFKHYGGDDEFSNRAKKGGWKLYVVPKAIVYVDQETTGLNPSARSLSIIQLMKSLFSINSTNNIFVRTRLSLRIPPWYAKPTYLLITYFKILASLFVGIKNYFLK